MGRVAVALAALVAAIAAGCGGGESGTAACVRSWNEPANAPNRATLAPLLPADAAVIVRSANDSGDEWCIATFQFTDGDLHGSGDADGRWEPVARGASGGAIETNVEVFADGTVRRR